MDWCVFARGGAGWGELGRSGADWYAFARDGTRPDGLVRGGTFVAHGCTRLHTVARGDTRR